MTRTRSDIAEEMKELLSALSPIIEKHTSAVCPSCTRVCCRQGHGRHRERDIAYLAALGETSPQPDPVRSESDPCQFLGGNGCTRERWQRAWKCTWFFCDPLLRSIEEAPPREGRELSRVMTRIAELRELLK